MTSIHRQVSEATRSFYGRADLQRLFDVQERPAQKLMELMVRSQVGKQSVIERGDLLAFLDGATDAEDVAQYLAALRKDPPRARKRTMKLFVPRDFEAGNLRTISPMIRKKRGEFTLWFQTPEQLASLLLQLSTVLELPEFRERFCISADPAIAARQEQDELEAMWRELDELEQARAAATSGAAAAQEQVSPDPRSVSPAESG